MIIFVAEEQGTTDIRAPSYVTRRNETMAEGSEVEKESA
jgi:hypothetical protein